MSDACGNEFIIEIGEHGPMIDGKYDELRDILVYLEWWIGKKIKLLQPGQRIEVRIGGANDQASS